MKAATLLVIVACLLSPITGVPKCPNSDSKSQPFRPCSDNSLSCVRNYFQKHSFCLPVDGKISDEIHRQNAYFYFPFFNTTAVENSTISGFRSGKVEDLIVDKKGDNVVLTIKFDELRFYGKFQLTYYETGQLPKIVSADVPETYPNAKISTVFCGTKNLILGSAFSFADLSADSKVNFEGLKKSGDPVGEKLAKVFKESFRVGVQEVFQTRSKPLATYFIQSQICTFLD